MVFPRLLLFIILMTGSGAECFTNRAVGQVGAIDHSFAPSDFGHGNGESNHTIGRLLPLPDGNMLIAGQFALFQGRTMNGLALLDPEGRVVPWFNSGSSPNSGMKALALTSDNKIMVGGSNFSYEGGAPTSLVRLHMDGSRDTSFNAPWSTFTEVFEIIAMDDGSYLVGGRFTSTNSVPYNCLVRLMPDGSMDPSFTNSIGFNSSSADPVAVTALHILPDGRILVGGNFSQYEGQWVPRLIRLNSDGSRDNTFGTNLSFTNSITNSTYVSSIQTDGLGRILVTGLFTQVNLSLRSGLARLTADGFLDDSFTTGSGLNGNNSGNFPYSISRPCISSNGQILVIGRFNSYNGTPRVNAVLLDEQGGMIPDFDINMSDIGSSRISTCLQQADGRFILAGYVHRVQNIGLKGLFRIGADGVLDMTYNRFGTGVNGQIRSMQIDTNGRVLIAGDFTSVGGRPYNNLARLAHNGELDTTFNIGTGSNFRIDHASIHSSGRISAAGWFHDFNGQGSQHIVTLEEDGSNWPSFLCSPGPGNITYATLAQDSGKLVIGGNYIDVNNVPFHRIARILENGDLDETFNITGTSIRGASGAVHALLKDGDGNILVGGAFSSYNQQVARRVVKLDPNGSLVPDFQSTTIMNGEVLAMAIQDDGKILVGGSFSSNGKLIRLNTDGSLDSTFSVGLGPTGQSNQIKALALDTEGLIYAGGHFSGFDGHLYRNLVRLHPWGEVDTTFTTGTGFNSFVNALAVHDHKLYVAGNFTDYNGTGRNRIARLRLECYAAGTPCNDHDPCTENDTYDKRCECVGTLIDSDGDGVCDLYDVCPDQPEPGTPCDDGDPLTINDVVQPDCQCMGELDTETHVARDHGLTLYSLYPNPSEAGLIHLQIPVDEKDQIQKISIIDSRGARVYERIAPINTHSGLLQIRTNGMSAGYYTLLVQMMDRTVPLSFAIQ